MKDNIVSCIEQLEEAVLALEEQGYDREKVTSILSNLGLSHIKLPSAQVMTLFDLLEDGITPINDKLITALLNLCEAHKRILLCMAGVLDQRPEKVAADAQAVEIEEPETAMAAEGMDEGEAAEDKEAVCEMEQEPAEEEKPEKPQAKQAKLGKPDSISSIRVNTDKLDRLIDLVGKLMVTFAVVSHDKTLQATTAASLKELDVVIDSIKTEVEKIRLVPLKQIFMPMHRLVKSLVQKMNKKLTFEVTGDDLELDKMVVEYLNEPLVHLLRNAVDHGMETPDERLMMGKDESGIVRLEAFRKGETAYIRVRDDGRGLDPDKIRQKAMEKGLLEEGKEYTDQELFSFILSSGFSTAKAVTDVSGRGVGMDAVLNTVREQLGGDISIESALGQGSSFTLNIPLSRSMNEGIVDSLVTVVGSEMIIIPTHDVVEVYEPAAHEVVDLLEGQEAVDVRGHTHPLVRLADYFNLESISRNGNLAKAIVVRSGGVSAALLVDDILRQQQVVVTNFTIPVQDFYHLPLAGYGMMGDSGAMVLDVEQLMNFLKSDTDILEAAEAAA